MALLQIIWRMAKPAAMENLERLVKQYLDVVRDFGNPASLAAFGLSEPDTVAIFSALEEDYHLSRYLRFSYKDGPAYPIGGQQVTHVTIDQGIREAL